MHAKKNNAQNPAPLQHSSSISRKNGSALIVAIIFISVVGLLVGGYLKVALNEYKNSQNTFYNGALLNLAEGGLEEAFWAVNNGEWDGWAKSANDALKVIEDISISNTATADLSILVMDYRSFPIVLTEAKINMNNGASYNKQLRVELGHRSIFANGLTAKDKLYFKGTNIMVDSFDSANGGYNFFTNRGDKGTIGSTSVEVDAVDVQNAVVYGYVATGNAQPDFGPNARIYGADTPLGVKIDTERIATDFVAEFPLVNAPATAGAITSLPAGAIKTIGIAGAAVPEVYHLSDLEIKNNEALVIDGPVVIVVDDEINVKGEIRMTQNGRTTMYVNGDIDIGGNGMVNETNVAANMVIYGTNEVPYHQDIFMHGNAFLTAAVFAPNADITLSGGGNTGMFFGAAVGVEISMVGNYAFHYDEQLSNFAGEDPKFQLKDWREIYSDWQRVDFSEIVQMVEDGRDADVGMWGDRIVPIPPSSPDFIDIAEGSYFDQ